VALLVVAHRRPNLDEVFTTTVPRLRHTDVTWWGGSGADRGRGGVEADLTSAAMVRRCSDVEGGAPRAHEAALGDKGAP
jgi:hypothetical protein